MPIYEFLNKETNELEEYSMRIAELDDFKLNNPHLERYISNLNIGDSVRLGITKPPADFQKGVIERMKASIPGNKITSKWDTPREW